ncbi:hypothetical protein SUGI_0235660 [Cryptomeria japonica]|uniref:uncharacterized protein LOC131035103 n=1 Tax=Cryptomeria japonica TaxID=3369 RepID=UPI002408A113|nr:uncharacterized protein LOC131035103 [Cryptomeria japonica]GLJ14558.1 hypothetical protein SUGI_0235660 [Cryptomeria japonica]
MTLRAQIRLLCGENRVMALYSLSPFRSRIHSQSALTPLPAIHFHSKKETQIALKNTGKFFNEAKTRIDFRAESGGGETKDEELRAGSPVIVVEAPAMVKTAEPMPMLRRNDGYIKAGDVGRILERKPKDVWAVRLARGAYFLDRKYFKPLEMDDDQEKLK